MCGHAYKALKDLPASLRAARQYHKKSGVEVAEALGMSPAAYRRYERGEVVPSAAVILQLAELYGCSPTAVMRTGGVEADKPESASKHSVELNLEAGDTFTITINATAAAAQAEEAAEEFYEPPFKPQSEPRVTKAKSKKRA
jgi:transcriptional regulator with XRE-family HTH domain